MQDYGAPKKITTTATGFAALSLWGQLGIIVGSIGFILLIALLIRYLWRRHKGVNKP